MFNKQKKSKCSKTPEIPQEFSKVCAINVKLVEFDTNEKNALLKQHNELRNHIASGKHKRYNSAQKMAVMRWDTTLERMASLNIKQCNFAHDQCRNTYKYLYSGQNLGIREVSIAAKSRSEIMKNYQDLINIWISEGDLYCDQSFIEAFRLHPKYPSLMIGHFTEMVKEENMFVGCSGSHYFKNKRYFYTIACNYATTNFLGEKIYHSGPPCSGCLTGCHTNYSALCSEKEYYKLVY